MNKKYTIIVVILFVIVCAVLIAFAITSNAGQRIKLLENAGPYGINELDEEKRRFHNEALNNRINTKMDNMDFGNTEISSEMKEKMIEAEKRQKEKDNKILSLVNKYYPERLQKIYDKLDGKSIYDENKELEYEFDTIILDIIETKGCLKEEKNFMLNYMNSEKYNIKENAELFNRIEKICK